MGPRGAPIGKLAIVIAVFVIASTIGWTLGGLVFGGKSGGSEGSSASSSASKTSTKGWSSSTDKTSGITLDHPKSWKVEKVSGLWVLYVDPESVVKAGGFRRNIVVQAEDFAGTLDDYTKFGLDQFQQLGGTGAIAESSDTTVDGTPAHRATYTFPDRVNNQTDKAYVVWTVKDGKAYVATYTSEVSKFDEAFPNVKTVFDKIQLPD